MTKNRVKLLARHAEWLSMYEQSFLSPTLPELAELWGIAKSSAYYMLKEMVAAGLAASEMRGTYRRYYPLPIVAEKEEQS
jgi:DNA-binding IclR family transcriptional regulator